MKEKWGGKKLFYLMLLIVIFSLGLTAIVVSGLIDDTKGSESKQWFFEESIQTGKPVELKNVYITKVAEGKIDFLYENISYSIPGTLGTSYTGVADIVVKGDKISKLRIKPDSSVGTLHSYNETTIQMQNETMISLNKQTGVPVYKMTPNGVVQSDWNEMIIGASSIKCIMEQGEVCSIIIEESLPQDIRVVIKNGSKIFYENLWVKKKSTGELIDIKQNLIDKNAKELIVEDTEGLYLCDAKGEVLGEYYEGALRVIKDEQGLVLVNHVSIETYVKYVLPSEMPTRFHAEALKAQAVCARTFAYAHMKNQSYAKYGANLDDSTSFQVYHATGRFAETDAAVDATKGEIITYNGNLITCYYFSTSAGKTNDMSVWGTKTPEYIYSAESVDTNSPFYKWKAYLTVSDITSAEVLKKNVSGYVTELKITYSNGTETILMNENDIRKIVGKYLQEVVLNDGTIRTDLSMIPSANFEIIEKSGNKITLSGGGFGHGIGMSQYGANKLAEEGIGYKDIIEHYFLHVVVKSV